MNNNNLNVSRYVPPPPPSISVQQVPKAKTAQINVTPYVPPAPPSVRLASQQGMLPPPPPPNDRNFWLTPMISKEAVAGAPSWIRPVAEFATQLTTPLDVAITLGTAGLGPLIAGGRAGAMGIRGGLRGLAAAEGRGRAANLALRGAANIVEPAFMARGALPARLISETGVTAGGHFLAEKGHEAGGIPGMIVGALGGGIAGGAVGVGVVKGMGKAAKTTPGLRTFFADPFSDPINPKVKTIDPESPTELTVSEDPALNEDIEKVTQIFYDDNGIHYSDAHKMGEAFPMTEKNETAESILGQKAWQTLPTALKNSLHKVQRLWNPQKHLKNPIEKLKLIHTMGMAMVDQEAYKLKGYIRTEEFDDIFGETQLDVTKANRGMFKFRDDDGNIIKDHPLFTEENLKKMKELGIDPENLSATRIFDEVNPLINRDITGVDYGLKSPPPKSETGFLDPTINQIKNAELQREIYAGRERWGIWDDILNEEQKKYIIRRAKAFDYTNNRLIDQGIDTTNRGKEIARARDNDLTDIIEYTPEELEDIAKASLDAKELTPDDYNKFQTDLRSEQGYSARSLWTKQVKHGEAGEVDVVIVGKDPNFGYKVNGKAGSEYSRKFSRVRLSELEGYTYKPANEVVFEQLRARLRRAYNANFDDYKIKFLGGQKYVDDTGEILTEESIFGPFVTKETRRRRAIKILFREYGPKKLPKGEAYDPKYLEELINKYEAGEKVAMPYPIANRNELRSLIREANTLKEKMIAIQKSKFKEVNFTQDEVDMLKAWVESTGNSALDVTKFISDPTGDNIIDSLAKVKMKEGGSVVARVFKSLPNFAKDFTGIGMQQARIEAQFAVVLAHARRIMGVDYVNQYPILKPLLDGNTKNYNFPAAKKYLQQRIQEYIKDVNDNTYKELTILRNQLDQLEKIATTLDPEDIPSIAAIEEEITALSANIVKRQNLLEVWRKAGRPKNLNFDQGQDYIKGMSYGINGWNPTGEGYTTGEAVLDSVFQLQKDLEVPTAPAIDVDELKFVEELIDDAKEYNYNYDMTPKDLDNFIKALDNTSKGFKNDIKGYQEIIDNVMKREVKKENMQEILIKTNTDFINLLSRSIDPIDRKDLINLRGLEPDEFGEYNLEKIYFNTTKEQMITEGIPVGPNEEDVFLILKDNIIVDDTGGSMARPHGVYDEVIKTVQALDEMVRVSNIEGIQKWWLQANSMQRMVALGIDASVINIHLLPMWFNHPAVQATNVREFWKTLLTTFKDQKQGSILVQNYKNTEEFLDWLNKYPELLTSESNEVFQVAAQVGWPKAFEKLGKPFELAFGRVLDVAGIELVKALDYLVDPSLSAAEQAARRSVIAQYVNDMRGLYDAGLKGISPKQANIESSFMLAGRYRRAIFGIWAKAFTGTAFERYMAQKALINLFTGLAMTTMALQIANSAIGGDDPEEAGQKIIDMLDPTSGSFLLFSQNDQKLGPGSKFVSDARILAKAMNFFYKSGTQEDMEDWENFLSLSENNPGIRWVRAQMAYSPSTAWDFFTGTNYIGEPQFREGENSLETIGNFVSPFTEMVTPLWINSTFFENTQGNLEWSDRVRGSGTRFVSEFTGLRAHPQGASGILKEASWDIMNAPYDNLEPFEKDILRYSIMDQLSPLQEQTIKRGTNDFAVYFSDIERIEKNFQNELIEMTKLYPNTAEGNRNMYDRYRQLKSYIRGQKFEVGYDVEFDEIDDQVTDPKKIALNKYFKMFDTVRIPGTQLIDWEKWETEYDTLMKSLTLEQQAVIARNTSRLPIPYVFLERLKYLGEAKEYKRIMKAQQLREIYLESLERPDLASKSRDLYLMLED